jgi:hypothetical protein
MSERDVLLNGLFDSLLKSLIDKIKKGEAKPADLAVARQFLKDNHIEALPEAKPGLINLKQLMPDSAFAGPDDTLQ